MTLQPHLVLFLLLVLNALATPCLGAAYAYNMPASAAAPPSLSGQHLAHKQLLLQSPSLDNLYMDYVVSSKPMTLRKYKNGNKTKKTKKDSKIYYIPIPPLPYRYIPGVGYDYQPMKINPILPEATEAPTPTTTTTSTTVKPPTIRPALTAVLNSPSKVLRVQHHKNYYFNGRPFRLQVAHADKKYGLTPLNLKSKFYYNKNIIY